jgi:hypothetical protein
VESRLSPRRSRRTGSRKITVTGEDLYEMASPPRKLPFLCIQDALRLGNSHPAMEELTRLVNLIHHETDIPTGNLRFFSKLLRGICYLSCYFTELLEYMHNYITGRMLIICFISVASECRERLIRFSVPVVIGQLDADVFVHLTPFL